MYSYSIYFGHNVLYKTLWIYGHMDLIGIESEGSAPWHTTLVQPKVRETPPAIVGSPRAHDLHVGGCQN